MITTYTATESSTHCSNSEADDNLSSVISQATEQKIMAGCQLIGILLVCLVFPFLAHATRYGGTGSKENSFEYCSLLTDRILIAPLPADVDCGPK